MSERMEARATSSFDGMAPTVQPSLLTLLRAAHSPVPAAAAATAMTDDGSETRLVAVGSNITGQSRRNKVLPVCHRSHERMSERSEAGYGYVAPGGSLAPCASSNRTGRQAGPPAQPARTQNLGCSVARIMQSPEEPEAQERERGGKRGGGGFFWVFSFFTRKRKHQEAGKEPASSMRTRPPPIFFSSLARGCIIMEKEGGRPV